MPITVPVAGDRIVYTWPESVAAQLNRMIPLVKTADQSINDGTNWADIVGLTFPVVSGRQYGGIIRARYSVSATNQGLQILLVCPTGNVLVHVTTYGQGAPNTATISRLAASGDATSISSTDGTTGRAVYIDILSYDCTATGTFGFQMRRGGTSGSTGATIHKGANGLILVSA
jgi:hypothetical protein